TWSHFFWPQSAAAKPGCCATRCVRFTFNESSEGMSYTPATSLQPEDHCSPFSFISSKTDAGGQSWKRASRDRASRRKISSSFSCREACTSQPRKVWEHLRCEFVTSARSLCVIP